MYCLGCSVFTSFVNLIFESVVTIKGQGPFLSSFYFILMTHLSLKVPDILHRPREISAYSLDLVPKSSFPRNMQVPREGEPYLLCCFVLSRWQISRSTWHIVVIHTYLLKRPITHLLSDLQLACFPLQALVFHLEIKMTTAALSRFASRHVTVNISVFYELKSNMPV